MASSLYNVNACLYFSAGNIFLYTDAYFYVGISENVEDQDPPYGIIPDENGSR